MYGMDVIRKHDGKNRKIQTTKGKSVNTTMMDPTLFRSAYILFSLTRVTFRLGVAIQSRKVTRVREVVFSHTVLLFITRYHVHLSTVGGMSFNVDRS